MCQDPRQFVPPSGQSWTCVEEMQQKYANKWKPIDDDEDIYSIWTEPKFGIGQRCILICTPEGNVLWDCITHLDEATKDFINSKGGLKAIVISHPHYYTTHLTWAKTFSCPIFLAADDESWLARKDSAESRRFIGNAIQEILPGVTAVKIGGHFPGSLVLHYASRLFIADSLVTVPSAMYHRDRPQGTTSYAFMWSIPNMIPLPPTELQKMWSALKPWQFTSTHGAFFGQEVRDSDGGGSVKARVLTSMKIQARGEGWAEGDCEILRE